MPNFKVINPDTPEEIDLVQDIPLVDEETGSDQIDSEGNILVKRYVTRSVSLNGINAVKDSLPQIKENAKNLKDLYDYSHSVNTDQQNQILENSSKITELLTDTTALEVTVTELENKIKGIQGIDIDEVKADLDALKQSAYLITGGTLKGDISVQTPNTATVTLNPSGLVSSASFSCTNDMLECTSTWGKLFKQSEEGGFFYGLSSTALADKNGKELTNYISDIMGSNAQLTFIKGDGTSQVISINNVISATKATQDGNGNVISDTYLPISGGTLNGDVDFTHDMIKLRALNPNAEIALMSGTTHDNGAEFVAYGLEYSDDSFKGKFKCRASDGTTINDLIGEPNGSLTWGGKNLVRSVNGVIADAEGNVQLGNAGGGASTGEVKWFAFNTAPDGYLVCNGANVSRKTYADLFAVIGTTYGSGDGSTTFALPNLIDKFAQGSTTVGTVKNAGLPNITGTYSPIHNVEYDYASYSGCFAGSSFISSGHGGGGNYQSIKLNFNAAYSSSIYGKSTTVQPPALTLLPCIKY